MLHVYMIAQFHCCMSEAVGSFPCNNKLKSRSGERAWISAMSQLPVARECEIGCVFLIGGMLSSLSITVILANHMRSCMLKRVDSRLLRGSYTALYGSSWNRTKQFQPWMWPRHSTKPQPWPLIHTDGVSLCLCGNALSKVLWLSPSAACGLNLFSGSD